MCDFWTNGYDRSILPLLHRMSNLEELDLCLCIDAGTPFVDGDNLKLNILNYLPLLTKLTFNIYTYTRFYNEVNFPSNDSLQQTFKDFPNANVNCCIDYFKESNFSQCHIYTYPYRLAYYDNISNHLPSGIFRSVRKVSLFDERPFEHQFFLRLAQSFPLMKELIVKNKKRQNNKRFRTSTSPNAHLSIIKYKCLIKLDLFEAHKDYYEQFFFETKTCLPTNVHVYVDYQPMRKITRNFRRNTTRSNSVKISSICFEKKYNLPAHFHAYFPYARIF